MSELSHTYNEEDARKIVDNASAALTAISLVCKLDQSMMLATITTLVGLFVENAIKPEYQMQKLEEMFNDIKEVINA